MRGSGSRGTTDERFASGSFALLILAIGQARTAVKAASGAQTRRDLDSGPGLPNGYLSWRAKETFDLAIEDRAGRTKIVYTDHLTLPDLAATGGE
jgi:hypothetical protein